MSKLDEYNKAKKAHQELCLLIDQTALRVKPDGFYDSGHILRFQFWKNDGCGALYSERLNAMLANACVAKAEELVSAAIKFSKADLAEKAQAAQDEAVETLKTVRVEKGEKSDANSSVA